ncbi:MAG: PAS domain S-box protein [Leptospiraceae bacterium]|nr:PAS domain S-box protein [Leptospiraceae bacterium]MCP5493935.1 PAS domain S-box protein [Leptospiraceae bacterium]
MTTKKNLTDQELEKKLFEIERLEEKCHQIEQMLRESEAKMQTIVDMAVDAIITINEKGIIQTFNVAAEKMFGYKKEEVIGQNVKMLMPSPYKDEHDRYLHNYITTGKRKIIGIGREVIAHRKDGSNFPMELAVSEVSFQDQKLFTGIIRDITTRKETEKALLEAKLEAEEANKAKSNFLANMSHEIRTPMNAVIGFSELLSTIVTDAQQKNYVDSIRKAGKSLLTLINDILDFSKIEAGRLEIHKEPVNSRLVFEELKQLFDIRVKDKDLQFILEIDKDIPDTLLIDEYRLRQVLVNLIGNAIKFTDRGFVKLAVNSNIYEDDKSKVDLIISVQDTGIGIPQEYHEYIFESFRQQDSNITRKYGGTGLGLAISKKLVEMMNGKITVQSNPGVGSTFTVSIRDVNIPATTITSVQSEEFDFHSLSFDKSVVLVVDDIESNRNLIREWLKKVNLDIIEAENGEEGFRIAKEYYPDLILMDIRMPKMNGYEAADLIRKNEDTKHIPIIALTASVTIEETRRIRDFGFDTYLAKPVDVQKLFKELSKHLSYSYNKQPEEIPIKGETLKKDLKSEIIKDKPKLMEKLKKEMMQTWESISEMMEMSSIEEFANEIKAIGIEHRVSGLQNYAQNLFEFINAFDVIQIENEVKRFPKLVEEIENSEGFKK